MSELGEANMELKFVPLRFTGQPTLRFGSRLARSWAP